MNSLKTNNGATVFDIAIIGQDGSPLPVGRTNPQRRIAARNGEIIRVRVEGVSVRQDRAGTSYTFVMPNVVPAKFAASAPTNIRTVEGWAK